MLCFGPAAHSARPTRQYKENKMATNKTGTTQVGVFATREAADRAVADLRAAGYSDDQIGVVAKDSSGKTVKTDGAGDNAAEGAAIGAAAGAGAMALGSLALSFGVIPVIGPILAVGPLAAALISAGAGAAAGSLTGALIGWGIPEEDAKYYEGEVKAGRYVVTVQAGGRTDSRTVFAKHGGYDRATAPAAGAGQTMQLKEEELHVSKRNVQKGEVEVRKEVVTEQRQITVPVQREEVVIERRPAAGAAGGPIKAEQIRIPVSEEKVDVRKETVVKEEVSVGKRKVAGTETVGGTVRKEEVKVETTGDARVRDTGK
jgi:uncharacterized protein (TIGR02271 family)